MPERCPGNSGHVAGQEMCVCICVLLHYTHLTEEMWLCVLSVFEFNRLCSNCSKFKIWKPKINLSLNVWSGTWDRTEKGCSADQWLSRSSSWCQVGHGTRCCWMFPIWCTKSHSQWLLATGQRRLRSHETVHTLTRWRCVCRTFCYFLVGQKGARDPLTERHPCSLGWKCCTFSLCHAAHDGIGHNMWPLKLYLCSLQHFWPH